MMRRRLTVYTLFYIAGITAGFFAFERSRIIEAAGFCAAVIAAVFFTDTGKDANTQKAVIAMMFFTGFLMFSFRSLTYNAALSYVQNNECVRGRVMSVSVKDEKVRFIIRNSEKGPARILVTLDEKAAQRSAENAGTGTAEAFVRSGAYGYTGEMIEARGEYTEIPSADDPGCFDYKLYMKSKGVTIRFKAYILEVTDTEVSPATKVRRYLYGARESFISRFDPDTQGFIRGVIFGDKSEIDEDLLEEFNNNSTGHILAVSGLHIGFLYGLLRFLTARRRTLPVSILITAVILLYGEMTMWSPATVRACIVMTISLCASHLRRCSDLLTSVSLAALMILVFQPYQLFNSGFQLSFLALCGIAFLTHPLSTVTGDTIAVMLAVQIGTIPVIAYSYCSINPLSILINVPVIMLASVLVPLCILLLMMQASILSVPAAGIELAELISYAVMKVNHILSFGGSFSVRTAGPGAAFIIVIYMIVFGLSSEWTRVMLLRKDAKAVLKHGILLLMPLAMLFSCLFDTLSDDEIIFAAVGQGDCVHIRAEGHDVLIDGGGQAAYEKHSNNDGSGSNDDEGYNVGKSILMPYLMHSGADAVDIALVTHLHADHYKGIEELSEVFPVGAIGIPVDYRSTDHGSPEDQNTRSELPFDPAKIYYIEPDTEIDITEDVSIDVIWPVEVSDDPIAADDPNEHNTVYMIRYKDINGSKSSSAEAFLDAAKPRLAVIQCGRNNFYGHPHKQTLERLEERGIPVFRTDLSGAVGIDIRGSRLSVDLYK